MIITNHTENSFTDINTEAYEVLLVQLRHILAVGMVTQTGAYFFLAASVPLLGSSSANATLAKEHTAAAAAVNTRSLLIFMLCSWFLFSKLVVFSLVEALTTVRLLLLLPEMFAGSLEMVGRNEDVMVIDAIANW